MTKVRGMAIVSTLRYIREKRGVEKVLNNLDEETRNIVSNAVIKDWYPYESIVKLYTATDKIIGNGDLNLCEEIGEFIAKDNLNFFLRLFVSFSTPKKILRKTNTLWGRYLDSGEVVMVKEEENSAVYRLINFDSKRVQCLVIVGWLKVALDMVDAKNIQVIETKCKAKGEADYCEFLMKWK